MKNSLILFICAISLMTAGCFSEDKEKQANSVVKAENVEAETTETTHNDSRILEDFVIETQDGRTFDLKLELADTPEKRESGLMNRTELSDDEGMVFFEENGSKIYKMWMKDTKIPLDMLFVDSFGEVQHIHWEAQPMNTDIITYNKPVRAVLELRGGVSIDMDINPGDQVIHDLFDQKEPTASQENDAPIEAVESLDSPEDEASVTVEAIDLEALKQLENYVDVGLPEIVIPEPAQ